MFYYDDDYVYSVPTGPRSGYETADCVCLIEGDTNLRVRVEATRYWVAGHADERGELPPEHDTCITKIALIGKDIVVDERDVALLTGLTEYEVERSLVDQVDTFLDTGEDESITESQDRGES